MSQPRKVVHLPKVRMLSRGGRAGGAGIRITHVKSIKPPDPDMQRKHVEDKLRAQLQKEIVSRARTCANKSYECPLGVVSGRAYCARHILQDPTAPYRQCAHTSPTGTRCTRPAPTANTSQSEQGLCFEHARLALHVRQRNAAPPPPVTTTETLLNQLQHYVKPERPRTTSCASSVSVVSDQADTEQGTPDPSDPFKQLDATVVNAQYSTSLMECASGSDSDCDSVILGPGGDSRADHDESDLPFPDAPSEQEPLWRAGVFTAEEAVREARGVLSALQAAYVRQMRRLRALLQAARAQYIKALKAEKEQYCSINAQSRSGGPMTVRERRQLRKLKAYASYHRKHGIDALLARKLHRKRARAGADGPARPPAAGRCTFAEGGVRCSASSLPAARHCLRHVLCDPHQVLFTMCGDNRGVPKCREPIPRLPLPSVLCRYHTTPPAYTTFTLKKDGTDSDSDSHSSSDGSHTEDFPEQSMENKLELPEPIVDPLNFDSLSQLEILQPQDALEPTPFE